MIADRAPESSLRLARPEFSGLALALLLSLALHGGGWGGYKLLQKFHLLDNLHWPKWIQRTKVFGAIPKQPAHPPIVQEAPLLFVNVDPQQAVPEPPKNAKYYSSKNSQAANPDATVETGTPKISGKQTEVVKVEDTPRAKLDQLQPDFAQLAKDREARPSKPKTKPVGDLVLAKPDVTLRQDDGFTEHSRPRTIKEALMRQNRTQLVGEKMKQEGGVRRHLEMSSLDAKATPFGSYDAAMIEAIQSRWYDLLDQISYNNYRNGRVVVQFRLNYDGRITDMRIAETTVGDTLALLCQKAILDPAPYEKWPQEMRQMADKDFRDISFTFYYN